MSTKSIVKIVVIGRSPKRTLVRAVVLAAFCLIVFKYFLIPVRMNGMSMEPTYHDGGLNFVNLLTYRFRDPRRGDVVAIEIAGKRIMLLKRIIGLPGETVAFANGALYINGRRLLERYVQDVSLWYMADVKCDGNEYFVAGDNRSVPIAEHLIGRAGRDKIVGVLLF